MMNPRRKNRNASSVYLEYILYEIINQVLKKWNIKIEIINLSFKCKG